MIRVLQVVTDMGRGGLETMIMNYYRRMDRTRIQFDFLVHRIARADYDDEIESLGGRIYRLPRLNPVSPAYHKALKRFFAEHPEYTIVHSHLDCMSALPLGAAKQAGVPVRIAHAHSSSQDKDWKYLLKLYYKTRIRSCATGLFACSEAAGEWMFGTTDFTVLPNAIDAGAYTFDPEKRAALRQQLGVEDCLVIGHVGRFSPVKNQSFLLDVLAEAKNSQEKVKLLLVGGGGLLEDVRSRAEQLGVSDSVLFLGIRGDICDLLQAMDVFVMPSLYEGLPVTIVEAQAAGLPCLISDRVPIECKKTDLVSQLSLAEPPGKWAEAALAAAETPRRNTLAQIQNAGFDSACEARKLMEYYLECR